MLSIPLWKIENNVTDKMMQFIIKSRICQFSSLKYFNCSYNHVRLLSDQIYRINLFKSSHHIWPNHVQKCLLYTISNRFYKNILSNQKQLNSLVIDYSTNIKQEQVAVDNEDIEKEKQRRRQAKYTKYTLGFLIALFGGSILVALYEWGSPPKDENGNLIKDQFSDLPWYKQYLYRTWDTLIHYNEVLKEPSRELLLPPPLQLPYYQPPYTLVIEMTGLLVHPDWTYKTGWRFKRRPFVDYLLQQLATSGLFEIVIYTKMQGFTAFPILENLDPNQFIMYRLFRDSTKYENGVHIKDLTRLNRDLSRVIHVDIDRNACKLTPNNCLVFKEWDGDSNDRTLYDLTNFLKAIATEKVLDVRDVINHYSKYDDPIEAFKENQRKLAEQEKEKQKEEQSKSVTRSLIGSFKKR